MSVDNAGSTSSTMTGNENESEDERRDENENTGSNYASTNAESEQASTALIGLRVDYAGSCATTNAGGATHVDIPVPRAYSRRKNERKLQMCPTLKEKRSGVDRGMRPRAQMRAHRVQSESERHPTRVDRSDGRGTVDHCRGESESESESVNTSGSVSTGASTTAESVDRGRVSRGVTRGSRVYD